MNEIIYNTSICLFLLGVVQGFFLGVFSAPLVSGVSEILSFCNFEGYFGLEFSKNSWVSIEFLKIPWVLTAKTLYFGVFGWNLIHKQDIFVIKGKKVPSIFRFLEFFWKKCLSFREKFLEFEFLGPWVFWPTPKKKACVMPTVF